MIGRGRGIGGGELICYPMIQCFIVIIFQRSNAENGAYRSGYSTLHLQFVKNVDLHDGTRCPSTDEWRKKLWYIYTMEYSATC